ncbi:Hrp-dependent type III effector protein [Falsiroseomonas bella]|uniref:Hrp-dependent type III effector protein n=1 Tax=Falsiroseomonas bella TaxID=2184016 RepID=A0A317F9G2_9PROT|nr:four-carbon acid sugar kinase family protein [Falsiroseomonas bella]PWS34216.1 Hrp-dependent type III effector protein [Falsiroseomonas bella]
MSRLRLLADDLTGALDATAPFAASAGHALPVALETPPDAGALDADTRDGPANAARSRASALAPWLAGGRPAFRKLDSLLRGHVAAELAASAAGGFSSLVIAPAFPGQGRRMREGRLLLADGTAGPDLGALLPAAGLRPRRLAAGEVPGGAGAWLCDVETEADLAALARADLPQPVLWAGSGGLARALAGPGRAAHPPAGPLLLLCGSRHARAAAMLPGLGQAVLRPASVAQAGEAARRAAAALGDGQGAALSLQAAGDAPGAIWRGLAETFAGLPPPPLLGVVGGRSLRDLCLALGVMALDVAGEVRTGLPLSRLRGGPWDGTPLISSSGAFDDRGLFRDLLQGKRVVA